MELSFSKELIDDSSCERKQSTEIRHYSFQDASYQEFQSLPSDHHFLPDMSIISSNHKASLFRMHLEEVNIGKTQYTCWIGNIADGVTDELLGGMLDACGNLLRWRRVLDASNSPKSFGFGEFAHAGGLLAATRLLHGMPFLKKP